MKYKITLQGKTYEVEVEAGKAMLLDEYEAIVPSVSSVPAPTAVTAPAAAPVQTAAPAATAALAAGEVVSAPMPGNILRIDVTAGQQVSEGQVIMILEAMKMENEIVATKAGTIAQVIATKGSTVDTGAPLAVIS